MTTSTTNRGCVLGISIAISLLATGQLYAQRVPVFTNSLPNTPSVPIPAQVQDNDKPLSYIVLSPATNGVNVDAVISDRVPYYATLNILRGLSRDKASIVHSWICGNFAGPFGHHLWTDTNSLSGIQQYWLSTVLETYTNFTVTTPTRAYPGADLEEQWVCSWSTGGFYPGYVSQGTEYYGNGAKMHTNMVIYYLGHL